MANQFEFRPEQIDALRLITSNGTANFAGGYRYISTLIANSESVTADTKYWFLKAAEINSNDPQSQANAFIRSITIGGLAWDGLPTNNVSGISDSIGRLVIQDLLSRGGIPELSTILAADISSALQAGNQTIGGWGGSFYYWDLPFQGTTVGETILQNPAELEKFLAVNAKATFEALVASFGSVQQLDLAGDQASVEARWNFLVSLTDQARPALSSTLPPALKAEIISRVVDALAGNQSALFGDTLNIDGYVPIFGGAGEVVEWRAGSRNGELVIDPELQTQLQQRYEIRVQKTSDAPWAPAYDIQATPNVDGGTTYTWVDTDNLEVWSQQTFVRDLEGYLNLQSEVLDSGETLLKQYDADNKKVWTERDIRQDADGNVTDVQLWLDNVSSVASAGSIGQVFGSAIGRAIAGDNQFAQLAGGTVGGLIGQKFAQVLSLSLTDNAADISIDSIFSNVGLNLAGAAAGSVASFLTAELGTALGLDGYGAQLFNAGVGGFTGSVLSQVVQGGGFSSLTSLAWRNAFNGAVASLGGSIGSILAQQILHAETQLGAIGGQLAGAIGGILGATLAGTSLALNFLLPGIGSFLGTLLGTWLGDLLGAGHPFATTFVTPSQYLYAGAPVSFVGDGGDLSVAYQMAGVVQSTANSFLTAINGIALDQPKWIGIGYQTDYQSVPYTVSILPEGSYNTVGAQSYFATAQAAVDYASLSLLRQTKVIGGELLLKRAAQNSQYADFLTLGGDLQVAQDYGRYLDDRATINALMALNPNSAFTAGWIATFARVNDLGLSHYGASDFFGGLVGYLSSVKLAGLSDAGMDISVSKDAGGRVIVELRVPNGTEVPGSLSVYASETKEITASNGKIVQFIFDDSLLAGGFHTPTSENLISGVWQANGSGGNDLWFGHADTSNEYHDNEGSHDILVGGSLGDIVHAGSGWDFVDGRAGNDQLFGEDGNDILRGGEGGDALFGGAGNDTYLFNHGDGLDSIFDDYRVTATVSDGYWGMEGKTTVWVETGTHLETTRYDAGADVLSFGAGITAGDLVLSLSGNDLIVGIRNSANPAASLAQLTDKITIQNWLDPFNRIETLKFADGSSLNAAAIMSLMWTDGNDVITWTETAVTLHGGAGNDALTTGSFNDALNGGAGDDVLNGGAGNDVLNGDDGNDILIGGLGDDIINGGTGNDTLTGGEGNDTLDGGAGNDALRGGTGNDTYLFGRGSGADAIDNSDGGADRVVFGSGIVASDLTFARAGNNLQILIAGASDTLTVTNWFLGSSYQIGSFVLSNGSIVLPQISVIGTAGSDAMNGTDSADILNGLAGNDTLNGGLGNDTLIGGYGNDALNGGGGNDTYVFNRGDGIDTVFDDYSVQTLVIDGYWYYDSKAGPIWTETGSHYETTRYDAGADVLSFGPGVSATDLILSLSGSNLIVGVKDPANPNATLAQLTDKITLQAWTDPLNRIETFRFADGSALNVASIVSQLGTSGNDTLSGTAGNDWLSGQDGNDTVTGGAGNDIIIGGAGTDTAVYTGNRRDYVVTYNAASQSYTVADQRSGSPNGTDTVGGVEFFRFADWTLSAENVLSYIADVTLAGGTVAENAAVGTVVGTAAGLVSGTASALHYALVNNAGGRFAIDAATGVITVANGASLDYETSTSQSIVVRVTNDFSYVVDKSFVIAITNVNEAPTGLVLSASQVDENLGTGAVIGTVAGTDPDANAVLTYTLLDNGNGRFALDAQTGQLSVADASQLDSATTPQIGIVVRVTDQGGLSYDKMFTIEVLPSNSAPTDIALSATSVAENSAAGTVVATLSASDPNSGEILSYAVVGGASDKFTISGNQLVVKAGAVLDFESQAALPVTIRVTDHGGLSYEKTFTIALTDVNEAPSSLTLNSAQVAENAPGGTVVGTVAGADPDVGAVLQYTLVDSAGGRFVINQTTGVISVANGAALNYEAASAYTIVVRATDQGGLSLDKSFVIGVTNVNEAPTGVTLTGGTVADTAVHGTVVGRVVGSDPDAGTVLSYALTNSAGGLFAIDAASGVISIDNAGLLTAGRSQSLQVTVRVTDQGGLTYDQNLTLSTTVTGTVGTAGNDTLTGTTGNDRLVGLAGNDTLNGGLGNDTLIGGYGNDTLNGGGGNDTYVFNRGDGIDTVFDDYSVQTLVIDGYWYYDSKAGPIWTETGSHYETTRYDAGADVLSFGPGVSATDLILSLSGSNLIVGVKDPANPNATLAQLTDKITLQAWTDPLNRIETFRFADGSALNVAALAAFQTGTSGNDTLSGTAGNDWLSGQDGNDTVTGGAGNDIIIGGAGNDTITGGIGNDILIGGAGQDLYQFSRGDGQDHIINGVSGNAASGELRFGAGVATSQLWLQRSNNDLLVSILGTQDRVTVDNWYSASSAQLADIKLFDGSTIDSGIAQLVQAMATYSASNSSFNITSATQAPADSTLQNAIAAAWHQ